jgi:hypothetical protein
MNMDTDTDTDAETGTLLQAPPTAWRFSPYLSSFSGYPALFGKISEMEIDRMRNLGHSFTQIRDLMHQVPSEVYIKALSRFEEAQKALSRFEEAQKAALARAAEAEWEIQRADMNRLARDHRERDDDCESLPRGKKARF